MKINMKPKQAIPIFHRQGKIKIFCGKLESDLLLCLLVFCATIVIAINGFYSTVFSLSSMLLFLALYHSFCYRKRIHTKFFAYWAFLSFVVCLVSFQIFVVAMLKIMFYENLILSFFALLAVYFAYKVRLDPGVVNHDRRHIITNNNTTSSTTNLLSKSKQEDVVIDMSTSAESNYIGKCAVCLIPLPLRASHCVLCGVCVQRRDHHCIWLNTCIGANNHRYFILGLICIIICLIYGANLTLTSICHPFMFWGAFLVPFSCEDVYNNWLTAFCFVGSMYACLTAFLTLMVLLQQLFLIALNTTVYEVKRNNRLKNQQLFNNSPGVYANCINFWFH